MKHEYKYLVDHKQDIELMNVHSYEMGLYLVEVNINGERGMVVGNNGKPKHFHSVQEVKEGFEPCQIEQAWLLHESAYDEMIGLGKSAQEPLKVPIFIH